MKFHENDSAHSRAKYEARYGKEKADPEKKEATDKAAAAGESKDDKKEAPAQAKEVSE